MPQTALDFDSYTKNYGLMSVHWTAVLIRSFPGLLPHFNLTFSQPNGDNLHTYTLTYNKHFGIKTTTKLEIKMREIEPAKIGQLAPLSHQIFSPIFPYQNQTINHQNNHQTNHNFSRPLPKNSPQDIYLKSRFKEPINNPSLT